MRDQDGQPDHGGTELREGDLERRVAELEQQVVAIAAAVDAASRMRVVAPPRLDHEFRIAGGRLVRRILEKGRLVEDYRDSRRTG
ncbi:hypothetical protein [Nocardioides sp. P5_C9_2]